MKPATIDELFWREVKSVVQMMNDAQPDDELDTRHVEVEASNGRGTGSFDAILRAMRIPRNRADDKRAGHLDRHSCC